MAVYYFHLKDGQNVLLDPEGRELADEPAIVGAALAEARALIADDVGQGWIRLDHAIEVQDGAGQVVHHLDFADAVEIVGGRNASVAT